MKMIAGSFTAACVAGGGRVRICAAITMGSRRRLTTAKSVLTSFSPSPCHLLVRAEAEIEKKVVLASVAIALPIRVLPVPGGPKSRIPFGGLLQHEQLGG